MNHDDDDYSLNNSTSPNKVVIYDANEDRHVIDYTDINVDYSKIDNLSPGWCMMLVFQDNLNRQIGFNRWKRYVSANFWNYLTTPINFTITLFTAISAGQTGTGSVFLSNTQLFAILFASFILSTINTFFKLKDKSEISFEIAKQYDAYGAKFEKIYYTNIKSQSDVETRLQSYQELHEEIGTYVSSENFEKVDYFSDLLFVCFKRVCYCFINNNLKQVNADESFWYLDGVKTAQTKELMLNTQSLFVYDFTKFKPKNNFFGLFGKKDQKYALPKNGIVKLKDGKIVEINNQIVHSENISTCISCFVTESNQECCARVNKWCNYHFCNAISNCYQKICHCECCEIRPDKPNGTSREVETNDDNSDNSFEEMPHSMIEISHRV